MSRWLLCAASITMLAGGNLARAQAQSEDLPELPSPRPILPAPPVMSSEVRPSMPLYAEVAPDDAIKPTPAPQAPPPAPLNAVPVVAVPVPAPAGYVRLDAPMYPSPRPNIPIWTGGTMITNQAFAPHEMLYPHTYRAMYPPFYHRAKGSYFWTPFGYRSRERWDLLGTEVKVKYRSHWPIFGPHHPVISRWHGPWY